MHLIKEVRDINRFKQILTVLLEEGFELLLKKARLWGHIPIHKKLKLKTQQKTTIEAQLRRTLERLGPTFIKFGQVLSVRPDLVPKSYIKELEKLQDQVPPFPFEKAKEILEKELKKPVNQVFSRLDKKPIASASISQVYRARLKTGEEVAVKIQRPDVRKMMETDIEILFYMASLLEKHYARLKDFKPVKIIEEFKEWTEKEIDFRIEARNAKRFADNFKDSRIAYIPKVFDDYVTERVLVTEFIEGIELHNFKEIVKAGMDFDRILKNGFELSLTQVFVHGLFHADPHPGNMIITKGGKIALIDFGIVGFFDDRLKNMCIDLLYGMVENDVDLIVDTMLKMGLESENMDIEEFRSDISCILQPMQYASLKDMKLSYMLEDVLSLSLKHKLKVPASFVLLGKTIITLEGIGLEYDPNFKIVDATKPFLEKLIAQRMSPLSIFRNFIHHSYRYKRFVEDLPSMADKALSAIEKGRITVDIKDTDIKKLAIEIDKSSNRIAYGLIISALLLSSAVMLQFNKGPKLFDTPIFSLLSFIFAAFLGIVLFWSILKEEHWLMGNNSQ
ncbi:AarF/ABC1/UbiB kinase family protein [Candidatus Woesearchaeota archaeon]|nr:AarF/ABC1/UbiB kinase family protein [Candidatus Woesearchaeota archaeon]